MSFTDTAYEIRSRPNFYDEVIKGNIQGHTPYTKWGRNPVINSTTAWVWQKTGNYTWQIAADTVNVVSDNAEDGVNGTGWRVCNVHGLGAGFIEISEAVTLNGATPVATVNEFIHIYRVDAKSGDAVVGSNDVNVGNISCTADGTGDTLAYVGAGDGGTMQLFDIVPVGKTLLLKQVDFGSYKAAGGTDPRLIMKLYTQPFGFGYKVEREDVMDTSVQSNLLLKFDIAYELEEKTRWWVTLTTDQAATRVSGTAKGVLIKNSYIGGAIKHL